jgi:ABC-type nickel/cobalt efflux system permease component RcnA
MAGTLTGWLLGLVLGMRHALEPDHLAAISTLVTDRPSRLRGVFLGATWGLGHTASLFAVGLVLALLDARMPDRLALLFELGVALMLIGLGVRAMRRAYAEGGRGSSTDHHHGPHRHRHGGPADHVHVGRWTLATRPLLIGLLHGLAGSGALTALVVANLPDVSSRLIYILLFGLGSVVGMASLSGLAGWPLVRLSRHRRALRTLSAAAGLFSAVLGLFWGLPLVMRLIAG